MTSTTDFLEDFSVSDWATLDFAPNTHPIFYDFQFNGSHFQQFINTRHLPLLFSYSSSFLSSPPTRSDPKLDFSRTSDLSLIPLPLSWYIQTAPVPTTGPSVLITPLDGAFHFMFPPPRSLPINPLILTGFAPSDKLRLLLWMHVSSLRSMVLTTLAK